MRYETDCADYEVYGDPAADHYDSEDNAILDRFDYGPACDTHEDCVDCKAAADLLAKEEKADSDDFDDTPF